MKKQTAVFTIDKELELPHTETIVGINTIQTKHFDNHKTENMSNKQTAVEWLINELESKGNAWENASIRRLQMSIDISDYLYLKRQAKKMEKDQMSDVWWDALRNCDSEKEFKDYYNETYGDNGK